MSSNQEHKIFDPGRELTRPEMEAYLAGKLSPEEMNVVERIAESSPLSRDALEGMRLAGPSPVLDEITKKVSMETGFFSTSGFRIGALLLVGLAVGTLVYMSKQTDLEVVAVDQETEETVHSPSTDQEPMTLEELSEEVQQPVVQTQITDSSISIVVDVRDQSNNSPNDEHYLFDSQISQDMLDAIELREIPLEDEDPDEERILQYFDHAHYHLKDYKVVDYRGIREEPVTVLSRDLTGVSANFSDESESNGESEDAVLYVAYVDYLKQAMIAFSEGRFKTARNMFKTIRNKYGEDANALFYGGMCAHELGKNKEAIRLFRASMDVDIQTFEQPSKFYMANSLWRDGKKTRANQLLQEIVEDGGYYQEKAELLLEKR